MSRLEQARAELARRDLDAMIVTQPENRAYLSGFTGTDATLLITAAAAHLATDARYIEQAAAQAPEFRVHRVSGGLTSNLKLLATLLQEAGARRVGFESDTVSYQLFQAYSTAFTGIEVAPAAGLVEKLREIKEPAEVEAIRRAAAVTDAAFAHALELLRPGLKESELALELEFFMRRQGAIRAAFDFIVASGPRSSMPHGVASDRVIGASELVTLDIGCVVDGYCSDMTRTVMVGRPDDKQREIYAIVLEAQQRGVAAVRPGITGRELDAVCRSYIESKGYGEAFGHSTGHGVGRYIHEDPRISISGESELLPGHVITIEPGIYLPGWGGVRVEDLVLVTDTGGESLSQSPRGLIILESL